jgi:hypothetical protein
MHILVEALLVAIYSTWGRANTYTHRKSLSAEYLSRPIIADPCPAVVYELANSHRYAAYSQHGGYQPRSAWDLVPCGRSVALMQVLIGSID